MTIQHQILVQHRAGMKDSSVVTPVPSAAETSGSKSKSASASASDMSSVNPPTSVKVKHAASGSISSANSVMNMSSISSSNASGTSYRSSTLSPGLLGPMNGAVNRSGNATGHEALAANVVLPPGASFQTSLECDYDVNPTELYQAIEAKQWDYVITLFDESPSMSQKQAATWVTRKETNGKLRWRLLPIHAAVIFQSPATTVERLLQECPGAAQAKDDQGMLPLHLAFRTKVTCWETVEELLTAHPNAVFVRDRKGRTPLQCGIAAASASVAQAQAQSGQSLGTNPSLSLTNAGSLLGTNTVGHGQAQSLVGSVQTHSLGGYSHSTGGISIINPHTQKAIFSVLELYTQIAVSDNVQRAMANSRAQVEGRIASVQESHVHTLTNLKEDWERQKNEMAKKILTYRQEVQSLKQELEANHNTLQDKKQMEQELVNKLQEVTNALEAKTVLEDQDSESMQRLQQTNKELLLLLQSLLDHQSQIKASLEHVTRETAQLKMERQHLLERFLETTNKESELSRKCTTHCHDKLAKSNENISKQLSKILNMGNTSSMEQLPLSDHEDNKLENSSNTLQGKTKAQAQASVNVNANSTVRSNSTGRNLLRNFESKQASGIGNGPPANNPSTGVKVDEVHRAKSVGHHNQHVERQIRKSEPEGEKQWQQTPTPTTQTPSSN